MSKNHSVSIDFDKLNNIPYIKQFDQDLFQQEVEDAIAVWSQYEDYYNHIALIRAVECTNGCVQYAYRDGDEDALTQEQSQKAMSLSMGFIIHKILRLPDGRVIRIPDELRPQLDSIRQLYYNGFKKHNQDDLRRFYANSVAMFNLLGINRVVSAIDVVKTYYEDVFTPHFLFYGLNYMKQFIQVTTDDEKEEYEETKEQFINIFSPDNDE